MERIAILGATGILGAALVTEGESRRLPIIRAAHSTSDLKNYALVDVTSIDSLNFFFESWNPKTVINCAAYTKVDDAEKEYDKCFQLNAVAPGLLAQECKKHGAKLVHISTDYVFGGHLHVDRPREPYTENEACSPCGVYGWSKYFGEQAVRSTLPDNSLIVRISWLHGLTGPSFIKTILRIAKEKESISVVDDQFGGLTYAPWLAGVLYDLIEKNVQGIVHATSEDTLSWYDIAKIILEKTNSNCKLNTQSTEESGRPASRPRYSKLSTQALSQILSSKVPSNLNFIYEHLNELAKGLA